MKITSSTGYFRRKETGEVFLGVIWLGKFDSKNNYEEITKVEYDQAREQERLEAERNEI